MNKRIPALQSFFEGQLPDPRAIFCLYLLCMVATHGGIEYEFKFLIAVMSFLLLLFPALRSMASAWYCLTLILAGNFLFDYAHAANHYFATTYTAFMLGVVATLEKNDGKPAINLPRALLCVVFCFATFHKIHSSYFRSGRLLGDYFFDGSSLLGTLSFWIPDFEEDFISGYVNSVNVLIDGNILLTQQAAIPEVSAGLLIFCQFMAWSIIVVEVLVCVCLIWNKLFYSRIAPIVFLAFIWGTFYFRNEYAFFSLASTLFLLASPHLKPNFKYLFTLTIILLLGLEIGDIWIKF